MGKESVAEAALGDGSGRTLRRRSTRRVTLSPCRRDRTTAEAGPVRFSWLAREDDGGRRHARGTPAGRPAVHCAAASDRTWEQWRSSSRRQCPSNDLNMQLLQFRMLLATGHHGPIRRMKA
ncbi:unnamed protein product [Urochloa humidicola]